MPSALLVFSTASSRGEARRLAGILLKKRLAACINIITSLESHYWWKGKKERASEVLLLIKTRSSAFPRLEEVLRKYHSYSVPEIIAVPIQKGSKKYLDWLLNETSSVIARRRSRRSNL